MNIASLFWKKIVSENDARYVLNTWLVVEIILSILFSANLYFQTSNTTVLSMGLIVILFVLFISYRLFKYKSVNLARILLGFSALGLLNSLIKISGLLEILSLIISVLNFWISIRIYQAVTQLNISSSIQNVTNESKNIIKQSFVGVFSVITGIFGLLFGFIMFSVLMFIVSANGHFLSVIFNPRNLFFTVFLFTSLIGCYLSFKGKEFGYWLVWATLIVAFFVMVLFSFI